MKPSEITQTKILESANALFYELGYFHTSFSDIVNKTGLSKGNITYHFKSKQDILRGIVQMRLAGIQQLFKKWEQQNDPKLRLKSFCLMLVNETANLKQYGCPMGTLTSEMAKSDDELYQITLPMFQLFRDWLKIQFMQLNYNENEADELGMSLLSQAQGIATLTQVFRDSAFLAREVERLNSYIENL